MTEITGPNNVVFLVLDSLRKDRLSVYNDDIGFTDSLGALADDAVVFDDAVTQAPWTLPSHASMFTGRYPWEHGTTHARSYFDGSHETFISAFADAGYDTAAVTSNIWITPHKGMTEGFDYVENFLGTADNTISQRLSKLSTKLYDSLGTLPKRVIGRQLDRAFRLFGVDDSCKSEETVAAVESYLDAHPADDPFFCYVNLMEPHEPYHPPAEYLDTHGVGDTADIPQRQKDLFTMDDPDFEALRRIYDASVDYTDDLVGRITDSLAANGVADDTVVVVLSDHGQALGEDDGLFGHQFTTIDPVIETVLFVDHPDLAGTRHDQLFELRRLNELVPYYAGLAPEPDEIFAETVRGGCQFPENFTGFIPSDAWDDYYRKHRYLIRDGITVRKSVSEDGDARYQAVDRETGVAVAMPDTLRAAIDEIDAGAESGADSTVEGSSPDETASEADEEIQQRLEALGYR